MAIRITSVSFVGIKKIVAKSKVGYLADEHRKEEECVYRLLNSSFKSVIHQKEGYIKDDVTISEECLKHIKKNR